MNEEWASWRKEHKGEHIITKDYWKHLIEQYAYLTPKLFELVNVLVSVSPGTGPLERSYTKLEKICKKDRNNLSAESFQNLWLLANYQLKDWLSFYSKISQCDTKL